MFRMFIDFPISTDEESSVQVAKQFVQIMEQNADFFAQHGIVKIGYRLGNDEDRQKSNYLDKNLNGHVSSRKLALDIPTNPATI
jgi:hypothetical protein